MNVLVLGAGVIGTTAAWFLAKSGHSVTVIDRQPGPAQETSFANGGQISVSHAEPWANPRSPLKILQWMGREDSPLLFRPRLDLAQWRWALAFLRECLPGRTHRNIAQLVRLGLYSRDMLRQLRSETGIRYDHREAGILHFFTSTVEFEAARRSAELMSKHGCHIDFLSAEEVVRVEPALMSIRSALVGGTFARSDESGDANMFARELSQLAQGIGVEFRGNTTILGLSVTGDRVIGVRVRHSDGSYGIMTADAYLVCLGSHSANLLRPCGIRLLIYPAKGYSVTLPIVDESRAFSVSMIDHERKIVFSRLGNRLRAAGTAEFAGFDIDLNETRCAAVLRRVSELFPGAGDLDRASFWTGLRPATPSNVPYLGRTRLRNLFLNTGHGTLGWTHACGSGKLVADLMSGLKPEIVFAPAAPRFLAGGWPGSGAGMRQRF